MEIGIQGTAEISMEKMKSAKQSYSVFASKLVNSKVRSKIAHIQF